MKTIKEIKSIWRDRPTFRELWEWAPKSLRLQWILTAAAMVMAIASIILQIID